MRLSGRELVALAMRKLVTLTVSELLALAVSELLAMPVRELMNLGWVRVILLMGKSLMLTCRTWTWTRTWTSQRVLITGRELLPRRMHRSRDGTYAVVSGGVFVLVVQHPQAVLLRLGGPLEVGRH